MPPHGSAKKKKKGGRDGKDRGKRSGRGARGADHSRGVGGGSSLENLIDSGNEHLAMDRVREGLADLRRACALVPDSADAWDASFEARANHASHARRHKAFIGLAGCGRDS